ncbi:MAG: carboxypeptidase regulatory-like domain-containing protein, partial [Bacteroidota bacterium]
PPDIVLLDKIQSNPGSNSIVHNTYTWKNWAITSWYKDGFTVVDITRPDNLVQVGNYDTYPTTGSGFEGCWGVYPYFPSGTIVASNINALNTGDGEVFFVTPEYKRACYLEGKITDGLTGLPLSNARILIGGPGSLVSEFSGTNGVFKMGQEASGYFLIKVSKPGYQPFESQVLMAEGEVITLNISLFPVGSLTVSGKVISASDNLPVAGATVRLFGQQTETSTLTDLDGYFVFNGVDPGIYSVFASADDQG